MQKDLSREARLVQALQNAKAHMILNDVYTERMHECIEKALYGYFCPHCEKLLMPINLEAVKSLEQDAVYVHDVEIDHASITYN